MDSNSIMSLKTVFRSKTGMVKEWCEIEIRIKSEGHWLDQELEYQGLTQIRNDILGPSSRLNNSIKVITVFKAWVSKRQ